MHINSYLNSSHKIYTGNMFSILSDVIYRIKSRWDRYRIDGWLDTKECLEEIVQWISSFVFMLIRLNQSVGFEFKLPWQVFEFYITCYVGFCKICRGNELYDDLFKQNLV